MSNIQISLHLITDTAMQAQAETFRRNLCNLIAGDDNHVYKSLLLKYHKMAMNVDNRIRRLTREDLRLKSSYFNHFYDQSEFILNAIQGLIQQGQINYEEDCRNHFRHGTQSN